MVKTKADLKIKVKEFVSSKSEPFKTSEVQQYSREIAPNISLSMGRIAKYIKAADIADFNKNKKEWNLRTKPNAYKRPSQVS